MALDTDAWNWSVDDVQTFFRDRATVLIADLPHGQLPDLQSLLAALENHSVDGYTLLQDVNSTTLRDDFGIQQLGRRSTVMRCISRLRAQSKKYAADKEDCWPSLDVAPPIAATTEQPPSAVGVTMSPTPPGVEIKQQETEVLDARGRKRRKLNPTPLAMTRGYLPDGPLSLDEVFFGSTQLDQEIVDEAPPGDVYVSSSHHEAHTADDNFQFGPQNKAIGDRHVIFRSVRHFLQYPKHIEFSRNGRPAVARIPYDDDSGVVQPGLVVHYRDNDIVATREDVTKLAKQTQSGKPGDAGMAPEDVGDVDDDVLLPAFGEWDGDEEHESVDAHSSIENEEDMAEEDKEVSYDELEHLAKVVDDYISAGIEAEREKLNARGDNEVRKVWNQMKKSVSERNRLVEGAKSWISRCTVRIARCKADLLAETWRGEDSLRQQCSAALDVTIEQREEERWKISVWSRRQEPGRAIRRGKRKLSATVPKAASHAKAGPSFQAHPDDRLDFDPAPPPAIGQGHDESEVPYEADDEHFQTPAGSPAAEDPSSASREVEDDWIVHDDEAEIRVQLTENETASHSRRSESSIFDNAAVDTGAGDDQHSNYSSNPEVNDGEGAEDELPSPRRLVKPTLPSASQTPVKTSASPMTNRPAHVVTLTSASSSPSRPSSAGSNKLHASIQMSGNPADATADEVDSWDYEELCQTGQRQHLLVLLLRDLGWELRGKLSAFVKRLALARFKTVLLDSCRALQHSKPVAGFSTDDEKLLVLARELFIRYVFPRATKDGIANPPGEYYRTLLDGRQHGFFASALFHYLPRAKLYSNSKPAPGSFTAPVVISSSDEQTVRKNAVQERPPKKTRKKAVLRSETAEQKRRSAADRERIFNESKPTDSGVLVAMIEEDPGNTKIEINPVRGEDQDPIFIDQQIARRMQPHQIDGVRFLWREITAFGDDGAQGCVLAHTMGLGKTMQTITFLAALNRAARSANARIFSQLPQRLRIGEDGRKQLRILILAPPVLLSNWEKEIKLWADRQLGDVLKVESGMSPFDLRDGLDAWMDHGGVVLIGYDMFSLKMKSDNPEGASSIRDMLLEGPEIVVADELHYLKNENAARTKAALAIKTHSRIGLTGTPMSNNVKEINSVISFVAPGFLGDPQEFNAHFGKPIENGTKAGALASEKRLSTIRLKGLHDEIQAKVHRATIEVLKNSKSLKNKVEFVITVPLTTVQKELYGRTIAILLQHDQMDKAGYMTILVAMSVLTLLTNHPHCFMKRLLDPPKPRKPRKSVASKDGKAQAAEDDVAEDGSPAPTDLTDAEMDEQPLHVLGFSKDMVNSILEGIPHNPRPELSAKMSIFFELLDHCLQCKDKVLVFSSSLLTLDYLEETLKDRGHEIGRIDGHRTMKKKTMALQDFHDRDDVNIMLVSTRAGGVGLNIQDANRVFIFDFGFNPAHEEQAIGRAYRLGQEKPVFVYRFVVGGTFESNIYNMQLFKTHLAKRVVDKKTPRQLAEDSRDWLYPPKDVAQESLRTEMGKDANVLDKLRDKLLKELDADPSGDAKAIIRSIRTMETLQEEAPEAELDEEAHKQINEEREQRMRGKKNLIQAPTATQISRPVTRRMSNDMVAPPSTFAGTSATAAQQPAYNIGGLPMPR